jgi:multisubunit Na+/H+ antiporter MnhB subunit
MKFTAHNTIVIIIASIALALAACFSFLGAFMPGGGVAGGVMLAVAYIALEKYFTVEKLLTLTCVGLGLFIFSDMFLMHSKFSAIALNCSLTLSFGAPLCCIVTAFCSYKGGEAQ